MTETILLTSVPCLQCGKTSTFPVAKTQYDAYMRGARIQDAFPDKTPDERELILTGIHPECWNAIFPDDEDE